MDFESKEIAHATNFSTPTMGAHSHSVENEVACCSSKQCTEQSPCGCPQASTNGCLVAAIHARTSSNRSSVTFTSDPVLKKFANAASCSVTGSEIVWEKSKCVGKGSISYVFSAEFKAQVVAVKLLRMDKSAKAEQRLPDYGLDLVDELSVVSKRLKHPNVVEFIGAGTAAVDGRALPFIMYEYVSGGSLEDLFIDNSKRIGKIWTPELSVSLSWCRQMLEALTFLHEYETPLAHRDVKPANLLVTPDLKTVKLADFSLTAKITPASEQTDAPPVAGSMRYMAPEVTSGAPYPLDKADVFSAAVTCWSLVHGQRPFDEVTDAFSAMHLVRKGLRPPQPRSRLAKVLSTAWDVRPSERPTAREFGERIEKLLDREGSSLGSRMVRSVKASLSKAKKVLHRDAEAFVA